MDHEICDQAKAGKLIWSFIKIIAYAATAILISHCSTAHAQLPVVSGQAYNGYYGYYDGFKVQPASATITIATGWVGMDVQCSYQGSANIDLGVFANGQTITDTSSMGPNVPAGAPYTDTYYAYESGTLESTYSVTFSETGAVQNSSSGVYPWTGPNNVTGIWGCGGPPTDGTLKIDYAFNNESTATHAYVVYVDGVQIDGGPIAPGSSLGTDAPTETDGSHTWSITVDGATWQSGTAVVPPGGTVEVNAGVVDTFPASSPTPSPSPSATPSPSPTATPSATPDPSATPNPSASPTATPDGGGGGASPTPDGGGGGATPAPSSTPSSSGTGTGDNTEQEMEAAIQATFGNTAGAPSANANDFQPQGNYTPAPDNTTPGLDSARSNLDGNLSTFTNMVPDLTGFSGIGTQYSFQVDCSGFGFGMISLDFSPYQSGIQLIRALVLGMTGLILVIKFIKHMGPTL
jgi:hypothetical protein